MKASQVTKTLEKQFNSKYSLGFNRYDVLPSRVKKELKIAHLIKTGSTDSHNAIVNFLGSLTEVQYENWLKVA